MGGRWESWRIHRSMVPFCLRRLYDNSPSRPKLLWETRHNRVLPAVPNSLGLTNIQLSLGRICVVVFMYSKHATYAAFTA